MQRQIDRLFRLYRHFVKIFVDDIVIYFKIFNEHKNYFRKIFDMSKINNIFVKSKKNFIDYFTIHLLNQKINFLNFITIEEKLKIISHFLYFKILQTLIIYLNFIK